MDLKELLYMYVDCIRLSHDEPSVSKKGEDLSDQLTNC
jgi:hypothetical protein